MPRSPSVWRALFRSLGCTHLPNLDSKLDSGPMLLNLSRFPVVHDNQCPVGGPGDPEADCKSEAAGRRRVNGGGVWRSAGGGGGRRAAGGSATGGAAASQEDTGDEASALTIEDFQGVFILLVIMMVLSLIWRIVEKVYFEDVQPSHVEEVHFGHHNDHKIAEAHLGYAGDEDEDKMRRAQEERLSHHVDTHALEQKLKKMEKRLDNRLIEVKKELLEAISTAVAQWDASTGTRGHPVVMDSKSSPERPPVVTQFVWHKGKPVE